MSPPDKLLQSLAPHNLLNAIFANLAGPNDKKRSMNTSRRFDAIGEGGSVSGPRENIFG